MNVVMLSPSLAMDRNNGYWDLPILQTVFWANVCSAYDTDHDVNDYRDKN